MQITIVSRSGKSRKFPLTIDIPADATVDQLKQSIFKRIPNYYPERQRLTINQLVLQEGKYLKDFNIKDGDTVLFKDLGESCLKIKKKKDFLPEVFLNKKFFFFKKKKRT